MRYRSIACAFAVWVAVANASCLIEKELKLDIPKAEWPSLYFTYIDMMTDLSSVKRLREKRLSDGDIEVRVWHFGLKDLEGVVFTRTEGTWTGYRLERNFIPNIDRAAAKPLPVPRAGWEQLWSELNGSGIMTLPDSSAADCPLSAQDGPMYIIETNAAHQYRMYHYESTAGCDSAARVKKMGETIAAAFDGSAMECKETAWLACKDKKNE